LVPIGESTLQGDRPDVFVRCAPSGYQLNTNAVLALSIALAKGPQDGIEFFQRLERKRSVGRKCPAESR
jgi:hypothetical protein